MIMLKPVLMKKMTMLILVLQLLNHHPLASASPVHPSKEPLLHLSYYVTNSYGGNRTTSITIGPSFPGLLPNGFTLAFGDVQLFEAIITSGPNVSTSPVIGSVHTSRMAASVHSPSNASIVSAVIELFAGDYQGQFMLQSWTVAAPEEFAILGGTKDFRNVKGYCVVSFVSSESYYGGLNTTFRQDAYFY